MTPLFACFPVCLTFVALAMIAVIVLVFDLHNRRSDDQAIPVINSLPPGNNPWRLWWVFPVTLLVVLVVMLVLAWYWPE